MKPRPQLELGFDVDDDVDDDVDEPDDSSDPFVVLSQREEQSGIPLFFMPRT